MKAFLRRYPVPLSELLLAPLVFRAGLPALARAPLASGAGMQDLARFAGHSGNAIRSAMSRLRSSGLVATERDAGGVVRYRQVGMSTSIERAVAARPVRPPGFSLAIFSFRTGDTHARHVVREALRLHGFQKLAQNTYINGRTDVSTLEELFEREGVADNVYFFHTDGEEDAPLRRKLAGLFDLDARARLLRAFHRDLERFLDPPSIPDHDFARRLFYAGPVHYRLTFVDEPPLPAHVLPDGYPLDAVVDLLPALAHARADAVRDYFAAVHV